MESDRRSRKKRKSGGSEEHLAKRSKGEEDAFDFEDEVVRFNNDSMRAR